MKNEAKLGIGVVVLAALAGLVYVQQKKDASVGSGTTTSGDLPSLASTDDLDKIQLTNADKPMVELDKTGGSGDAGDGVWTVAKPVAAPAKASEVKSLLDNLKELKVKEVISTTGLTDEQKIDYQLDPGHAVHLVGWKGGDKKIDITFGRQGGRGELVTIDGNPGVYALSGYVGFQYSRDAKDWRQNEIFKMDDASVTAFTIENKNGLFSFTKSGDVWGGSLKGQPIKDFDPEKAKTAVGALKTLNADNFGDGKTTADTGLDTPESTVTLQLKDNTGKHVLRVGKVSDKTSHYAMADNDPTIYTISAWASDWALADASKFTKAGPADGGAPKDGGGAPAMKPGGKPGMGALPPGHPPMPPH